MNEFLRILCDLDVPAARQAWAVVQPDRPAGTDAELLTTLHISRTQADAVPLSGRLYSHAWLEERGLTSFLPDELRPKPEQRGPGKIVTAVGIAVHSELPGVAEAVRGAMEHAVAEAYADGNEDPVYVSRRMEDAKHRELRGLGVRLPPA